MKKIFDFCKEKYKILIPIMVAIVLLVTVFFLYREYEYDNTRNKKEVPVFQYFSGVRTDYTAIVTYNLRDSIVNLEDKNNKIQYDSIPVYYKDENKVIFPSEMSVIFPLKEGRQYKLYKYATYYEEEGIHYIKNNTDLGFYDYFFLFDGNNVFFFPYEMSLKINGKEYMKLGPMSYVSLVGGYTLIYYDTATDTSEVIELNNDKVTVSSEYINVNISEKYCLSFGQRVILMKPNNLNPVFKTIDK